MLAGAAVMAGTVLTTPVDAQTPDDDERSRAALQVTDVIVVFGERPSLTNDPTELSRARLYEIAGATAVIGPDERLGEANVSIVDAVGATPGVIAQPFFGGDDQPRIQMRGSGLQQNPTQRGVLILQDGLPLNRADGSYIVSALSPTPATRSRFIAARRARRSARRPSAAPSILFHSRDRTQKMFESLSKEGASEPFPDGSPPAERSALSTRAPHLSRPAAQGFAISTNPTAQPFY